MHLFAAISLFNYLLNMDQFEINESSIKQKRKLQIQNIIFNHKSDQQNKILLDLISNLSKLGVQKRSKLNNINSLTQQESKFSNIFYQSPMIFCDENLTEKKPVNEQLYSDLMSGYKRDISVPKFIYWCNEAKIKTRTLEHLLKQNKSPTKSHLLHNH
ncbi:hypothetical protein BpHYR1_053579 [Brachionus plicatilis]|uniref:Uncharacterized protein n=1 Tax=Brachionus plicatilis TaxID=10195 RepID=A0A3M7QYB8_BRAPC|nr:hypothetical protein BpHYR1_053579 [Brachionus plicatilis]